MTNRNRALAGLIVTAMVAGCHKQPGGQVAATVNGEEITLQELNTELQASNISASTDKQAVQKALVQRVIDRKLVDGLAKERDLDKSSDYLAQSRRLNEILLAQLYAKQQLAAVPVPSGADITKFMSDNPGIFANRQQLILDQIRFQQPGSPSQLNGIDGIHTMDGVASFLKNKGIQFTRQPAQIDSAALPAPLLAQINNLPAGEPFAVPTGGAITINIITARKAVANDPAQARSVAATAWREQKVQQAVTDQLTAARASAKISYQPGFEPPAKKPVAATPPKP